MQIRSPMFAVLIVLLTHSAQAEDTRLLNPTGGTYDYLVGDTQYTGPLTTDGNWYGNNQYWHGDVANVNLDYTAQATYPYAYLTTYAQGPGEKASLMEFTSIGGELILFPHPVYGLGGSSWWLDGDSLTPSQAYRLSPGTHALTWTGGPGTHASLLRIEVPEPSSIALAGSLLLMTGVWRYRCGEGLSAKT